MDKDVIINEYFAWLSDIVCRDRFKKDISYTKLLTFLHQIEFTFVIQMDKNRAADGRYMRYRFALANEYTDNEINEVLDCLDGQCSVLEMMVALATRCEENIMDNTRYGNRTSQWFWQMVVSLGLGGMYNDNFDKRIAEDIIGIFLNRDYSKNGKGGLFTIRNCKFDMRDAEIWYQMCWYLDTIA